MEEIQSFVDANSDSDNVSWSDSLFYTGSRRAASLRRHVARQIKDFRETEPAPRLFRRWRRCMLQEWMVLDVAQLTRAAIVEERGGRRRGLGPVGEMTSLLAATLGSLDGVAAGLFSGGLGVVLPCARSRLLPEVFDDCSDVCRRPSIRKMNESAFSFNFLETGGLGLSESCEKVEHTLLST